MDIRQELLVLVVQVKLDDLAATNKLTTDVDLVVDLSITRGPLD